MITKSGQNTNFTTALYKCKLLLRLEIDYPASKHQETKLSSSKIQSKSSFFN